MVISRYQMRVFICNVNLALYISIFGKKYKNR